jgi:tetratricopeptide (TPR) repeat protein
MLDALLKDGFAYHDSESERFAAELEAAVDAARASPALLVAFVRQATHTIGEHLGDWPRASRLANRVLAGRLADAATAQAWAHLSIARLLAGDGPGAQAAELTYLAAAGDDFRGALVEARFILASALVGCSRSGEAAVLYEGALGLARRLSDRAPARAIAIASNNLATDLLESASRDADGAALMRLAADVAHEYWVKCGDWKNDERALYLKAMVANALGEPGVALQHVERALAIISENGAAPIDETFLYLTRAHALKLEGRIEASARALAVSDARVATWDQDRLKSWYADERRRVIGEEPLAR